MDTKVLTRDEYARTFVLTHPGLDPDKQDNEDVAVCVATPRGLLCLVCDGMGGHENGKLAAQTAVDEIVARLTNDPSRRDPARALGDAIREANTKVFALSRNKRLHAGATCVAILIHESGTTLAHAGDSRAYLVHRGNVAQITRDHSKVREMVDRGLITPEEAKVHPEANQITRALGIAETVDVEVRAEPLPHIAGDVYVLCTDGLSDLVTPLEMLEDVTSHDERTAAKAMVDRALSRGGHDNTTVIVARILRDAKHSSPALTAVGTAPPQLDPPSERGPTTERPFQPVQPAQLAPPAAIPSNPNSVGTAWEDGSDAAIEVRRPRRGSRAVLVLGLVLAAVAVGILVALYVVVERKHKRVPGPIPHTLPTVDPSAAPEASLHPLTP